MKEIYSADTPSFYVFEDPRGRDMIQTSFSILKDRCFTVVNNVCGDNYQSSLSGNQNREIPSEKELAQKVCKFLTKMNDFLHQ